MPTGYTAKIVNGEVTELTDFIKLLARSRGAYYHMRNIPLDAPLKAPTYKGDAYNQEIIDQTKKELNILENFENAKRFIIEDVMQKIHTLKRISAENVLYNTRLEIMKEKIENWNPSKEYETIKNFGIEQLQISFDDNSYYKESIQKLEKELERLKSLSDEDWKNEINNAIVSLQEEIKYQESEIEKNRNRHKDAVDYHEGLMKEIESIENYGAVHRNDK